MPLERNVVNYNQSLKINMYIAWLNKKQCRRLTNDLIFVLHQHINTAMTLNKP